jgi:hypothetical protein
MISIKSIFLVYAVTYALCIFLGYILGKFTGIKVSTLRTITSKLYDPITVRIKKMIHIDFNQDIKKRKTVKMFSIIFLNNLLLAAFISRTIYGCIFFYPYIITVFGSFNQGIVLSRTGFINPVLFLEFLSYLIAATAGTNIGINLMGYIFYGHELIQPVLKSLSLYFYIIPILAFHTAIEVRFLTKFKIPENIPIDINKTREEMLRKLDGIKG